MKQILFLFISLGSFVLSATLFYMIVSYLLLSLPPFNKAVMPDATSLVAVILSGLLSIGLAAYVAWKIYFNLAK
ncbi:hypothetical protein [Gayadomonas joobiniege]|uniref:hypothetical protein n=1 Tax=Gayadomonas joobiniege TaxID=1234606 RepID=UPI00036AB506|nr:hypothetical protein [Gayadomonas joobiniege]